MTLAKKPDEKKHKFQIITAYHPHNRIRLGIRQEQCGFVRNTGTGNVVFIIRMLSEQTS